MQDILNPDYRMQIIEEILGSENKYRKLDSFKKYEVYRKHQDPYVIEQLVKEYTPEKARTMRKITSINLCKKIVDDIASIYRHEPEREFGEDQENKDLEKLYEDSQINIALKKANKYYKLDDQVALQVIPYPDKFKVRPLARYQYDVIPLEQDPEEAYCYILSTFDESQYVSSSKDTGRDQLNQKIADYDDKKLEKMRFTWWTAEVNLVTDGKGQILFQAENPIKMLPFIDIYSEKDMEFFIRNGSGIVDFSLDLSVLLSDVATINRAQGFAQAILYAKDAPKEMLVGAQQVLFLPFEEHSEKDPKFEFANPSPDLNASLTLIDKYLQLFLSAEGADPKKFSSDIQYKSGFERFLAMLESFEATQDDFDKFENVEKQLFVLMKAWSNVLSGSVLPNGVKFTIPAIPQDMELGIDFHEPKMVESQKETVDRNIALVDAGLKSKVDAIAEIEDIDTDRAAQKLTEIEAEGILGGIGAKTIQPVFPQKTTIGA